METYLKLFLYASCRYSDHSSLWDKVDFVCMHSKLPQLCLTLCDPGLQPTRLLCSWDSPDKDAGVSCHALLQGIFLTQGSNLNLLCLLHWQAGSQPLAPPRKPNLGFSPYEVECEDTLRFIQDGFTERLREAFSGCDLEYQYFCPLGLPYPFIYHLLKVYLDLKAVITDWKTRCINQRISTYCQTQQKI